jgi:primosomal protein N' (replication factor Y)
MGLFAKIVFESPLPQLDRQFDYKVPDTLAQRIGAGQRVQVPFGRNSTLKEGLVASLSDTTDFDGNLAEIESIVWDHPVLPETHLALLQAIADRQASTLGDVLKQAMPDRAVRVEKNWTKLNLWTVGATSGDRFSVHVSAKYEERRYGEAKTEASAWVFEAIDIALESVAQGQSSLICVPDYRDLSMLNRVLSDLSLSGISIDYSTSQTKSERYAAYLSALTEHPLIVVGNHNAIYAPVSNLGSIVVYDESDPSHQEQASPYANTRDIALIRNSVMGTPLHLLAVAPTTSVLRLEQLGYVSKQTSEFRPRVAFSSSTSRLDDLAYRTIQSGLKIGPVLIQVSNLGVAKAAYCATCSTRTVCGHCQAGSLWIDDSNNLACRVCSALNLNYRCTNCGDQKVRMGRAGSLRTAAEFGKSFPGVPVVEATGIKVTQFVDAKPKIVVATPDAAPEAMGGYAAIVILDADVTLGRDSLFAKEQALRQWANLLSLMRAQGQAALIGVPAELGSRFSVWNLEGLIAEELTSRKQLGFPPSSRVLSIEGNSESVNEAMRELAEVRGVKIIGKAQTDSGFRALATFDYSTGNEVAKAVKRISLSLSSARRVSPAGRNQRALTIKLDDWQVL